MDTKRVSNVDATGVAAAQTVRVADDKAAKRYRVPCPNALGRLGAEAESAVLWPWGNDEVNARPQGGSTADRPRTRHKTTTTTETTTRGRKTEMSDFRYENEFEDKQGGAGFDAWTAPEANATQRRPWWQPGRGRVLARAVAAAAGTGALVASLAIPAAASGSPNPWEGAQAGLTYPVYQPKTVLSLPQASFKLLSCGAGQDESVFATYGTAYTPASNYGKTVGFSVAEGYPFICANPGTAKQVGVWTVGIPNGTVKVRVSVYCDPAQFKSCNTASGVKNGYVLQWAQPYKSQFLKKQTQMFIDTSRLTLPQALHVVAGVRPV